MEFEREEGHPVELSDMILAKRIGDELEKHYPGWGWTVHVNSEQKIVIVGNILLSTYTMGRMHGFVIKMSDLRYEDEIARQAMRAGGEIIERMHQPRGKVENAGPVNQIDGVDVTNKLIEVVSR